MNYLPIQSGHFGIWTVLSLLAVSFSSTSGCNRAGGSDALTIKTSQDFPREFAQWDPVRFQFNLENATGNPFDSNETNVEIHLVCPDGTELRHPAFFVADHQIVFEHGREVARRSGRTHWEIRWTPTQSGEYQWAIIANSNHRETQINGRSLCTPQNRTGFVRVSREDSQYFEFSDGSYFYPLGHVIRSPSDTRWRDNEPENAVIHQAYLDQRTFAYDKWFEKMAAHHENFCAIWMAPWWLGLEWSPTLPGYEGLGRYNQIHAAQLDRILESAERHGIYVLLFVTNHGQLSSVTDSEWEASPYRESNGGLVKNPSDFFVDEECQRLQRNRLRYVLARWGYSPALFGISLSTETDWFEPYDGRRCDAAEEVVEGISRPHYAIEKRPAIVNNWLKQMLQFMRQTDIHHHIMTTQFSKAENGHDLWKLPEFDFALNNCYEGVFSAMWAHVESPGGTVEALLGWSRYHDLRIKPTLLAEWGGSHMQNSHSRLAAELHSGIWSLALTSCAGSTGFWWWNEIDQAELYRHYHALHNFLDGYDRRGKKLKSFQCDVLTKISSLDQSSSISASFVTDPARSALMLCNETEGFTFVYSQLMNYGFFDSAHIDDFRFDQATNTYLSIPDILLEGKYRIEFWNTFQGEIIESHEEHLMGPGGENRRIAVRPFHSDIAIKLMRVGE